LQDLHIMMCRVNTDDIVCRNVRVTVVCARTTGIYVQYDFW